MEHTERSVTVKTIAMLNVLVGIWLIVSPYIFTYTTGQAKWEQTIAGIVILVLAGVRYLAPTQLWTSWINALAGLWMIIAPFATGYQDGAAYWNEVVFGAVVLVLAVINAATHVPSGERGRAHHHAA